MPIHHAAPTSPDYQDPLAKYTPDQRAEIHKGAKELVNMWTERVQAKYRIEVTFPETRRLYGVTRGILELWSASSALNGQGDSRLCICPGRSLGRNNCQAALLEDGGNGQRVCPSCMLVWKPSEVVEGVIYDATMERWAHTIYGYYGTLGHNADIVLSYHPIDATRVYSAAETVTQRRDRTAHARSVRRRCIYPLKNFVHDVGAGADPIKRIQAFLTAD